MPAPPGAPEPAVLDDQWIAEEVVLEEPGGRQAVRQRARRAPPPDGGERRRGGPRGRHPDPGLEQRGEHDRHAARGGRGGDLGHRDRAADARRLHDEDVGRLGGQQRPGAAGGVDRLVGGERDRHAPAQLRRPGRVVDRERLLDVLDVEPRHGLEARLPPWRGPRPR